MNIFDRINAYLDNLLETEPPPSVAHGSATSLCDEDEDEGIDPLTIVGKVIDDSISAAIAKMVGEFRTELDAHDAVGWSEATKLTRDFLEHQLNRYMPLPDDDD